MKSRIILTKLGDLVYYPPVLTIIKTLIDLGHEIVYIGYYSDKTQKKILMRKGVKFIDTTNYLPNYDQFKKLLLLRKYTNEVSSALEQINSNKDDILWLFNADTIFLLDKYISKHKTILHFFEFVESKFNLKYLIFNPNYTLKKSLDKAWKIIHCEYNRAQIFKGLYQLETLPYILPNKPYEEEISLENAPENIKETIHDLEKKTFSKKVILYQGIFNSKQRRLEEFCEAVNMLSDEYVLIVMGKGNEDYEKLRNKYESKKIIFTSFINPPYHMLVTQLSSVGVLSYFPTGRNYAEVINPIYCAPNKIFEYSKFSKPMIGNDIPGLRYLFDKYKCGECIEYPMTPNNICKALIDIYNNYKSMEDGSRHLYNSVNINKIVQSIID